VIYRVILALLITLYYSSILAAEATKPWRLTDSTDQFQLTGSQLLRYENLDGQYRNGRQGSDRILLSRSILHAQLHLDNISFGAEFLDARQALADADTPLISGLVNTATLQQLYANVKLGDLLQENSSLDIKIGRQTLDLGSRRLIARSTFNTAPTSFTGLVAAFNSAENNRWRVFYMSPVVNLPNDFNSLISNRTKSDKDNSKVEISGFFSEIPTLFKAFRSDIYFVHLSEEDSGRQQTADRRLNNAGFRFYRPAAATAIDFELETVLQWGNSHASTSVADTERLAHRAQLVHIEVGYTFQGDWRPRLQFQIDYASGDKNPHDGSNNLFNTLYGDRRFDFGPTGIYGPFSRANLVTAGYRFTAVPASNLRLMLSHRAYRLAAAQDAWQGSGLQDSSGRSGHDLGHQFETRLQWDAIAGNLTLEAGLAWLDAGSFAENVRGTDAASDTRFVYLQSTLNF